MVAAIVNYAGDVVFRALFAYADVLVVQVREVQKDADSKLLSLLAAEIRRTFAAAQDIFTEYRIYGRRWPPVGVPLEPAAPGTRMSLIQAALEVLPS